MAIEFYHSGRVWACTITCRLFTTSLSTVRERANELNKCETRGGGGWDGEASEAFCGGFQLQSSRDSIRVFKDGVKM